ncbi:MAG TPA: hypothetical protein VMV65_02150 [Alphaproteobacteria bacterium]|nr:hypothetical protein [Alphaproteobacteria bacterium]
MAQLSSARIYELKRHAETLAVNLNEYIPNPPKEWKPRLHGLASKLHDELEQPEHEIKLMEIDGSIPRSK